MRYDDLLKSRRIRRERVSKAEIERALARARRDLKTAGKIIADSPDWGFAVAYNPALQAARAYMFDQGYRPASAQDHKNTFQFMEVAMGPEKEALIAYFDRMRNKRNRAIYDVAGEITETEARNLLEKATEFVELIRTRLGHRRGRPPGLKGAPPGAGAGVIRVGPHRPIGRLRGDA